MRRIALLMALAWLCFPSINNRVHAARLVDPSINLEFEYTDELSIRNATESFNWSQPSTLQAETYWVLGNSSLSSEAGVFELFIGSQSLDELLTQVQLRLINPQEISNRDLLDTTALEISGTSFTTLSPTKAILFSREGKSIAIFFDESSDQSLEAFLTNIRVPSVFIDGVSESPFQEEIHDVTERGIFSGYIDQSTQQMTFRPEQGINRAEFVKVIVLAAPGVTQESIDEYYDIAQSNIQEDDNIALQDDREDTQPLLFDVDRDAWFAPYIFYAYDQGWIGGYPDGSFQPTNLINVAEAAKIVLSSRDTSFAVDEELWFRPFLQYLDAKNVLVSVNESYRFPFTEGTFFPYENINRAQTAALLSRLLWVDESPLEYYAKKRERDSLPFIIEGGDELSFYELGRSRRTAQSKNSYLLFSPNNDALELLEFTPEQWTRHEQTAEPISDTSEFFYVTENRSAVFALRRTCENSSSECLEQDPWNQLKDSFSIRQQDLLSFKEENNQLHFLHALELEETVSIQGNQSTYEFFRSNGEELFTLIILKNSQERPESFLNQTPFSARFFGNHKWYFYVKNNTRLEFLELVSKIQDHVFVVRVPDIQEVTEISAKIVRILRTLSLSK